jgi:hypothetical protein
MKFKIFIIAILLINILLLNINFLKSFSFFKKKSIDEIPKEVNNEIVEEIKVDGNSFSFKFIKEQKFPKNISRTASIIFDNFNNYEIFFQTGEKLNKSSLSKFISHNDIYLEKNGGIKSVFVIKGLYFILITKKNIFNCSYLALIRLIDLKELIKSECIVDQKNIDFNGSGGAYTELYDEILLSIGTPENSSESIRQLAQDRNSIFGKIIAMKKSDLINLNLNTISYKIYSYGHRNPQGLIFLNNNIFSSEHGPQGGDELNLIKQYNNYGWPIVSYGTRYYNGKSFNFLNDNNKFIEPIYAFIPSVAPSALGKCPKNLINYYNKENCLMSLSLREQSILIILLDNNLRVISIEKFFLDKRLRHFGLKENSEIYFDLEDNFYFSSDNDSLYKGKFTNFR